MKADDVGVLSRSCGSHHKCVHPHQPKKTKPDPMPIKKKRHEAVPSNKPMLNKQTVNNTNNIWLSRHGGSKHS